MITTERVFTTQFLIELVVVGCLTILFGYIAGYIVGILSNVQLPEACSIISKNYLMEKTLFLTGIMIHLSLEVLGVNKLFCERMIKH